MQHVLLDCYYLNERASAGLALMKELLGRNTSFADGGTDLKNEEALKA